MTYDPPYLISNADPERIMVGGIYAVMTDEGLSKVVITKRLEGNASDDRALLFEFDVIDGSLQSQTILEAKYFDVWRIGYQKTMDKDAEEWIQEICFDLNINVRVRHGSKYPIAMTIKTFQELIDMVPVEP